MLIIEADHIAVLKMLLRQCYTENKTMSQEKTLLDTQRQQHKRSHDL